MFQYVSLNNFEFSERKKCLGKALNDGETME